MLCQSHIELQSEDNLKLLELDNTVDTFKLVET